MHVDSFSDVPRARHIRNSLTHEPRWTSLAWHSLCQRWHLLSWKISVPFDGMTVLDERWCSYYPARRQVQQSRLPEKCQRHPSLIKQFPVGQSYRTLDAHIKPMQHQQTHFNTLFATGQAAFPSPRKQLLSSTTHLDLVLLLGQPPKHRLSLHTIE
jgi:hypothetical protein